MRLSVNQKVSAACANRNRLIINPLSNNRPADFPAVGSHTVVNGECILNNARCIRSGEGIMQAG
ncbi:hypothetical protein NL80_18930 [Salmonella enterica subsp. enterica serovar Mbandaka]|nr:hypothetical protein [Salmonella enterica subsp. enterica serovar Mbandaka]